MKRNQPGQAHDRQTGRQSPRIGGPTLTTVATANQYLRSNLPGGGRQNPACAGVQRKDESAYADPDNGDLAGFAPTVRPVSHD